MSDDCSKVKPPAYFESNSLSRDFPIAWRDVWFRRYSKAGDDGIYRYECPVCKTQFDHGNISYLQGDHIWPYSLCGDTSWGNYRLICGSCNASKSNFVDTVIRGSLGDGSFRRLVEQFLRELVAQGKLSEEKLLDDLLGRID